MPDGHDQPELLNWQQRFDIYKVATEEYRFQVNPNWSRTQYYLGLNLAIIGAGTGILKLGGTHPATALICSVFGVGFGIACFSIFSDRRQHGCYREARDRMISIEGALGLPDPFKMRTTGGMKETKRNKVARLTTVTNLAALVFVVLGAIDVFGAIYSATQ